MALDDNQVSIDANAPIQNTVSIDTQASPSPMSPTLASTRAFKTQYGLGDILGSDYDDLYHKFVMGGEDGIRKQAAYSIDQKATEARTAVIRSRAVGGSLNLDNINKLLAPDKSTDPSSVIEQGYAHQYMGNMDDASKFMGNNVYTQAQKEIPEQTKDTVKLGSELITKTQLAMTALQNAQEAIKGQSWGGYAGDLAKGFVPLYPEFKLRGTVQGSPFFSGGLLGDNLYNQSRKLLALPLEDFKTQFNTIMQGLLKDNPQMALQFAQAVVGESTSDRHKNNIFSAIDIATVPGAATAGKLLLRKVGLLNSVRSAAGDMVQGQAITEPTRVAAPLAAGNVAQAAIEKVAIAVQHDIAGTATPLDKAISTLTSNFRLDKGQIEADAGNLSREEVTRILDRYDQMQGDFINEVLSVAKVERISLAKALPDKIEELRAKALDERPYYKDSMLDLTGPHQKELTGAWEWRFHLGNSKAELFTNELNARVAARARGIIDPQIVQQGLGYKIVVPLPIKETDNAIRDLVKEVPDAITPNSWLKATLGWIQTPAETTSAEERINRVVATYAPHKFLDLARKNIKEIKDITGFKNRNRYQDFERLVESGQQQIDPDTNKLGYFYKSPAEVQYWYRMALKRDPDASEVEAYFAFKRIVEMDRMLREIAIHRNQDRVGAEMHQLYMFNKEGQRIDSPFFAGVRKNTLPVGNDSFLIMRPTQGDHLLADSNSPGLLHIRPEMEEKLKKGQGKLIEVYDTERRELEDFIGNDSKIRYIYTENLNTKPLSWDQLPRRGGGHFDREYDHNVAQANMRYDKVTDQWHYEGDTHAAAVEIRGVGNKFSKALNDVRELIKDGKLEEAEALNNRTLPWTWEEHFGYYQAHRGPEGKYLPARFNVNEPFTTVPRGKSVIDMDNSLKERYGKKFRDGTREGSLARQSIVQYTQERDAYNLMAVDDVGTRTNPIFATQAAKLIDPIPMMNRGLNRIVNSFFMDDMKISAIEAWAKRASPYLKASPDRVSFSPFKYFNETGAGSFKRGADPKIISQLMSDKMKIDQFIGMPSKIDVFLHSAAQALADSVYGKLGPKSIKLTPTWLLPKLRDPTGFIRSVVYNEKVGLFSIPQFLVHATTYSTVVGVAGPRRAIPGTYAAMLHAWSVINPSMMDTLDKYASKLNMFGSTFKPGQFKESVALSRTTGFLSVEGEQAIQDAVFRNQIVESKGRQFLNAGAIFFRSGLQSVRAAAWHTAYREFRDINPTKLIGNVERNAILDRADLLAHNMSRASSSILNRGVLSLPMQFYTYQLRLAEIMTGKRITNVERMRLFGVNAAMFGVPVAASLSGAPIVDLFRDQAQKNGYVVGKNFLPSLIMEGGISTMIHAITGQNYNVGERYGTKGLEAIRDVLREDKTAFEIYGGAAMGTMFNHLEEMDGFFRAMFSGIKSIMGISQDKEQFPMTVEDFIKPLKEISSVNAWTRWYQAMNTGHWLSKNGTYLSDASGWDALFMTLSGLVHQETADVFTKSERIRSEKQSEQHTVKRFVEQMGLGFTAQINQDPEQAAKYFTRAQTILIQDGYPVEKIHEAYQTAAKIHQSLVKRIDWNYYLRDVPMFRRDTASQAYRELQQMQEENK